MSGPCSDARDLLTPEADAGGPGFIRVCFGVPEPEKFPQAAERLNKGLKQLLAEGFSSTAGQI